MEEVIQEENSKEENSQTLEERVEALEETIQEEEGNVNDLYHITEGLGGRILSLEERVDAYHDPFAE